VCPNVEVYARPVLCCFVLKNVTQAIYRSDKLKADMNCPVQRQPAPGEHKVGAAWLNSECW
jgi:hypothetical protein